MADDLDRETEIQANAEERDRRYRNRFSTVIAYQPAGSDEPLTDPMVNTTAKSWIYRLDELEIEQMHTPWGGAQFDPETQQTTLLGHNTELQTVAKNKLDEVKPAVTPRQPKVIGR